MNKFFSVLLLIIIFFSIIIGIHFILYKLAVSQGFLSIKEIKIIGNNSLSKEEIIQLSGLEIGKGIFDFDFNDVINNLNNHPLIRNVKIKRIPPSLVEIIIEEKIPLLVLKSKNGEFILDKNGEIMQGFIKGKIIELIYDDKINYNENFITDDRILILLENLSEFNDKSIINKIYYQPTSGFSIITENLKDTIFYVGDNIPDNKTFLRIKGIIDKIYTSNLNIKFKLIDLNDENAVGHIVN